MKLYLFKFKKQKLAVFVHMLIFLNFMNMFKDNKGRISQESDDYSKEKFTEELDEEIEENPKTKQESFRCHNENLESYFIFLHVEKSKFSDILSVLLKTLFSKNKKTIFCRRLSGLLNVSEIESYFFWEKIPLVLEYAYSNKIKELKDYVIDDYLYKMMEFYPSNESSSFQSHYLDHYINNIKQDTGLKSNKNTKKDISDAKNTQHSSHDVHLNNRIMEKEKESKFGKDLELHAKNPSFFCVSDAINPDVDYKTVGNFIKKKIMNFEDHYSKPIDIFNDFLKKFVKSAELRKIIIRIAFHSGIFPDKELSLEDIFNTEFENYVESVKLIMIGKTNTKIYNKENFGFDKKYLHALAELKKLEDNTWDDLILKYFDQYQNDFKRYIFLQLSEKNHDLIRNIRNSANFPIDLPHMFSYKLIKKSYAGCNFFLFERIDNCLNSLKKKLLIESKQKVLFIIYKLLKYTKITDEIKQDIIYMFLREKTIINENSKDYNDKDNGNYMYRNIKIKIETNKEIKIDTKLIFFNFECSCLSEKLYTLKISVCKSFFVQNIHDYLFKNTDFNISIFSMIKPNQFIPKIKLEIEIEPEKYESKEYNILYHKNVSNFHYGYSSYLRIDKFLLDLNIYLKKEKFYDRFYVINYSSFIKRNVYLFEYNYDMEINPIETYSIEKEACCEWPKGDFKPILYKYEQKYVFLLYRCKKDNEKMTRRIEIKSKIYIYSEEIFETAINILYKALYDVERKGGRKIKKLYDFFRSEYRTKPEIIRLIDEDSSKEIWKIMNKRYTRQEKITKCLNILFDRLLYKFAQSNILDKNNLLFGNILLYHDFWISYAQTKPKFQKYFEKNIIKYLQFEEVSIPFELDMFLFFTNGLEVKNDKKLWEYINYLFLRSLSK